MGLGLSGLRLGLGQQLWGTVWSPAKLFPTGTEEGLFLDFSDISTLYTDQTFSTNISAIGDPVGGVIDKSQGGVPGPEEHVSDNFDNPADWTTVNMSISGGEAIWVAGTTGGSNVRDDTFATTAGKTYEITVVINSNTSPQFMNVRHSGDAVNTANFSSGTTVLRYTAQSVGTLALRNGAAITSGEIRVGRFSVKELPGNHLIQATAAARPIWTRHPKSGVRNLLDYSDYQIAGTGYIAASATTTQTAVGGPTGTEDCTKIVALAASTGHFVYENSAGVSSAAAVVSVYLKAAEYTKARINEVSANKFGANFDLVTGAVSATSGTSFVSAGAEDVGGGWWRCWIAHTSGAASVGVGGFPDSSVPTVGNPNYLGDGVSGVYSFGMQHEEGSTPTAYQARVSKYDVTEAGVDDCYGLTYDGVDDYMVTAANLDLSGDDQVFACMGADMTDVATTAWALDTYTAVSTPSFTIKAPMSDGVSSVNTTSSGNGARVSTAGQSVSAPFVLSAWSDISAPSVIDRLDGASGTAVTDSQGTGNQSSGTLTLAARNSDKTLTFGGTIYGVTLTDYILDADQLAALEVWTAARTPEVTLA